MMPSKVILYADERIADRIYTYSIENESGFMVSYVSSSYDRCVEKAVELDADVVLFQVTHPVYRVQNFFRDLEIYNITPLLLLFDFNQENEIVYSVTSHTDSELVDRLKTFFTESMGSAYDLRFYRIGESESTNSIMELRTKGLEKTEYLLDILRGATHSEFLFYRSKANLTLNDYGYYLYLWNLTDIEYADHNVNKNIYYYIGEQFLKECQDVVDQYRGGEAFFINPIRVGIIINQPVFASQAAKRQFIHELTTKLNNVTKCKTAFRYMSGYINSIEKIRNAYESLSLFESYNFFCRDARLITEEYIDSIREEVNYSFIDTAIHKIIEMLVHDIFNPTLLDLIKNLFLTVIKQSLDYNVYYYCTAALSSALTSKYEGLYDAKFLVGNPSLLYYSSVEQKCLEFMESIHFLKAELSLTQTVRNTTVFQVIELVQEHYTEDISVNVIASRLNISNSYLSQMFKKEMGISIIQYIISYRIQKAKELISSGDESVSNIASRVGFVDVKHFSKTFKKITGLSPMQYKRQNMKVGYVSKPHF